MEKIILIKVGLEKSRVGTGIQTSGYSDDSITDQLELLGVMTNLQWIIQQRIVKLSGVRIEEDGK